ncbi:taste receptor type 2 member 143-like [Anomaloglossus baeobatrachus]|uniref:taste receptor type 2 member 143-like n=1 Tax=Anomaloglossus baeobatrachus TaxID=238106 RepID=UPI003F505D15
MDLFSPNTSDRFEHRRIHRRLMMPFTGWVHLIILAIFGSGTALILNIYILVASAQSLKNGQRFNPPDLIHLLIAVVNIGLQGLLSFQGLLSIYSITLIFIREFFVPTIVGILTLLYLTYWLTAWLCIYYCVTISNVNHQFFIWSKRNLSMYLPRLLLLSAAGCFFISLPSIWMTTSQVTLQYPVNRTIDPIFVSGSYHLQPFYILTASFLGCCVPFLLILVSIMVTNFSLIRHLWKMRQKDSGLSQTKDQAHVNAIRTMCCFLTISIVFYISTVLFFSISLNSENPSVIISWMLFMSFLTAEALTIIFAKPKLKRQIMAKVLWLFRKI